MRISTQYYLTLLFLLFSTVFAQQLNANRYKESIFSSQLTADVQYATAPQWVWPYWNVDLSMDIFTPAGDANPKRPLIIFAHAGGFINGSKDVDNMHAICDTFARKGFVTATIDYRKGFDPLSQTSAERAVYRAVQDGKAAVRFFKEYADLYDIDTNEIFFGGMSAGGFISYHVGYLDEESERPASTYGGGTVNDLECLDCAGNSFTHTSEVKAVLNYWGATIDTTFMQAGDVPIFLMHGKQDPTVPYGEGYPFGLPTLPLTYGSGPIKNQADAVGVPYQYYSNNMDIHMMGGSNNGDWDPAPNSFWGDTLLPFTTDFIFDLIKPNTSSVSPTSISLYINDSSTFEVSNEGNSQYEWLFDPLDVTLLSNGNSEAEEFSFPNAGNYQIKAIEYNHLLAAGDTIVFNIEVIDNASIAEQQQSMEVYPNPSNGLLNISLGEAVISNVQVFDLRGSKIAERPIINQLLDLSDLPSGVYVLRIEGNQAVYQSKITLIP
jgi:acetyl esterase/lipase